MNEYVLSRIGIYCLVLCCFSFVLSLHCPLCLLPLHNVVDTFVQLHPVVVLRVTLSKLSYSIPQKRVRLFLHSSRSTVCIMDGQTSGRPSEIMQLCDQ